MSSAFPVELSDEDLAMQQRNTKLIAAQIELCSLCRLKCFECPREIMERPPGVMKLEMAKNIASDLYQYTGGECGLNLNGLGEPLLYKHMVEFLEYIEGMGIPRIDLFTSLQAPEKLVLPVLEYLKTTTLSVTLATCEHRYGWDGKPQLDTEQFEKYFQLCLETPDNVTVSIAMIATAHHSVEEMESWEKFYRETYGDRCHVVWIKNLNPWMGYRASGVAHPDFGATPDTATPEPCNYPYELIHFGYDGTAIVCCTDDVQGLTTLGKYESRGDLQRIWESPEYEAIRRAHNCGDVRGIAACSRCERTAGMERDPLPEGALVG